MTLFRIGSFLLLLVFASCTPLFRPYTCGPVLKEDQIQIFNSVNKFLDIQPGDTYADVGSSSGYYVGAMAVFLDSVDFYLQDIDANCLNKKNVDRVLKYYSRFRSVPIEQTNNFHITIGSEKQTNLPDDTFDQIYSNATFHVLNYPDSVMRDLHLKLKDDGHLFIRDEFAYNGETKYCESKDCKMPLPQYQDFLTIMQRNGFKLVDESNDVGSYPIYKFAKR